MQNGFVEHHATMFMIFLPQSTSIRSLPNEWVLHPAGDVGVLRPVMLPVTTKETCSKSRNWKRLFVPESFWSYLNSHLYASFCLVIKSVQYRLAYDNANKINTHYGYTHISLRAIMCYYIDYHYILSRGISQYRDVLNVIFRYGTVLLAPLDPQPNLHSFSAVPQQVDGTNGLAVVP